METKELTNWIKQGNHDLLMAKKIIKEEGYDTCAFLCQQAVEKHLKAFFIYKNKKNPPKTHYLDELAKGLGCPKDVLASCKELSADYMISRYPDVATFAPFEEYDKDDAESKITKAEEIIAWIKKEMQK